MTASRDPDHLIQHFLLEGEEDLQDQVYDAVRAEIDTKRQRVVIGPWRTPVMNRIVVVGLAAVAVVAVVLIGSRLLGPPGDVGPYPSAEPSGTAQPSVSPSAAQTAIAHFPVFPGAPQPVDAGIYDMGPDFPVSISFVVPAGWLSCANNAGLLCPEDGWGGVEIYIVTNVVADPCDGTTLRDPPVGPTVDDLVAAISSLPWSAVTPPNDVTVDGMHGKEFEVTAPTMSLCVGTDDFRTWATTLTDRAKSVSPGERNRLRILDVQGTRVVIAGSYLPGTTSSQDLAEINAIIDSVRIEPQGG